jgi:hypothetical protein
MKLGEAEFSHCGNYRYLLTRTLPKKTGKSALFVMLNPSTANEFKNDPTIARCVKFAEREGCDNLTIVNIFALRSTDPKVLKSHPDPIGPLNRDIVAREIMKVYSKEGLAVLAWGANFLAEPFNRQFTGSGLWCLGKNRNGSPKHPLYVKSDKKLELF